MSPRRGDAGPAGGRDTVWLPDLADPAWAAPALLRCAGRLGLPVGADLALVDARLSHPDRPRSTRASAWALYAASGPDPGVAPVRLLLHGLPDLAGERTWRAHRAARPAMRVVAIPGRDVLVWTFPDDPGLPRLRALLDPQRLRAAPPPAVRDALGGDPPEPVLVDVVRYQPGASATLRVTAATGDDAPRTVYAKLTARTDAADLAAHQLDLWRQACRTVGPTAVRLAEPLAVDPGSGPGTAVLWTRGVPPGPPDGAGDPAAIGLLLSGFHALSAPWAGRLDVGDLYAEAGKKAGKLARLHPDARARLERVVLGLRAELDAAGPAGERTLHGDFHLDQLVGPAAAPVLVDLDAVTRGPAEVDVAEFTVDLVLRAAAGSPAASAAGDGVARLCAGLHVGSGHRLDRALLRVCVDAEFLNRCYRHVRRQSPGWAADLDRDLARHAEVVDVASAAVERTVRS